MQTIKEKIKNTTLLGDEDKIAILVAVDGYSASDVKALEKIIDEYDAAHIKAVADYKTAVYKTLDSLSMPAATGQVKQGMDELLQV